MDVKIYVDIMTGGVSSFIQYTGKWMEGIVILDRCKFHFIRDYENLV